MGKSNDWVCVSHKYPSKKWSDEEVEYLLKLKKDGKSNEEIASILNRSISSVSAKSKRLNKKNRTYNKNHIDEKNSINYLFINTIHPLSILDLYCGTGNPAYSGLNVTSNDIDTEFECNYHLDALHCLCKLYSENNKFDMIDLDPFGSAYECFDLAIKMAKKGLCITLGEMGHKRWKRLDYVRTRYDINSLEEFTSDKLIEKIQCIGLRNHKSLKVYAKRDWQNISRVWFLIEPYKETSQWEK